MAAPDLSGHSLPTGAGLAALVAWDTSLNSGAGGWAVVNVSSGSLATTASLTLGASDIQIGAVEIKNDSDDTRAKVGTGTEAAALRVTVATDDVQVTRSAPPGTGTITSVGDEVTSTTVLASNSARKGATFYNDSSATLYLALSNTTASTSVYSVQIAANGYYELPVSQGGVYTGIVVGIWASDAGGSVRVTELT